MNDWIDLLPKSLPIGKAIDFVSDPSAGGVSLFLGTTRAEVNEKGQRLTSLDYEAYAEMATKQFHALAVSARSRWPLVRLAVLHRLGRVGVGEASVVIAVSTPHRADAFAACRWLIDSLKAEATIWKKEVWDGGEATWVHPDPPSPKPE